MALIVLFLGVVILWNVKFCDTSEHFFDKTNSNAMRGFWCLVVILVHVPFAFQNRIQDMIGSFAYIGVTFFFLTSGYGLTLSYDRTKSLNKFWRKRLPKLLITNWVINIFYVLVNVFVKHQEIRVLAIFEIAGWVRWLLACYFFFWLSHIVFKNTKAANAVCFSLIALLSLVFYALKYKDIYTGITWTTECVGFIWGMLLYFFKEKFKNFNSKTWIKYIVISCAASGILGLLYLKFKPVVFLGDYLLKIVLGIAITVFILILDSRLYFNNRINQFLGNISYEIYLIHGCAFSLIAGLVPGISSGLFILSALILAVILAVVANCISQIALRQFNKLPFMQK